MPGQPRRDREWENWPGRGSADDGIRHRLRTLFASTENDEEAIEALIAQRGREIEEQTDQLQATIADLERREEQTGRLRSAVEEMLRHGSAELDERHADLATLARELGEREERVRADERDIAVRKQELGAVELRRAAVERREEALAAREEALDRISAELTRRESELAAAEEALELISAAPGRRRAAERTGGEGAHDLSPRCRLQPRGAPRAGARARAASSSSRVDRSSSPVSDARPYRATDACARTWSTARWRPSWASAAVE